VSVLYSPFARRCSNFVLATLFTILSVPSWIADFLGTIDALPLSMTPAGTRLRVDLASVLALQRALTKIAHLRTVFFHQVSLCETHAFRERLSTFWAEIFALSAEVFVTPPFSTGTL